MTKATFNKIDMKTTLFALMLLVHSLSTATSTSGQPTPAARKTSRKAPPIPKVPGAKKAQLSISVSTTPPVPMPVPLSSSTTAAPPVDSVLRTVVADTATGYGQPPRSNPATRFGFLNSFGLTVAPRTVGQTGTLFNRLYTAVPGDMVYYTRYGMGAVLYLNGGLMATLTRSTGKDFAQIGAGAILGLTPGQKLRYVAALGAGIRLSGQVRVGGQISLTWQKIASYGTGEKTLTAPGVGLIGIYTPSKKVWVQATANTNTGTAIGLTCFL